MQNLIGKFAIVKTGDDEVAIPRIEIEYQSLPDGKWACNYCYQTTSSKSTARRHVESKHLLSSGFDCFSCSYKTNRKESLKSHCMKVHKMNNHHFDAVAREKFGSKKK